MKKFLILALVLCGCGGNTPTESIIDEHVKQTDNVLEYAKKNFDQTQEIVFLEEGLTSCRVGLVSAEQSYKAEIATCEAKTNYWRLSSTSLFVALCVAIFLLIKRR